METRRSKRGEIKLDFREINEMYLLLSVNPNMENVFD